MCGKSEIYAYFYTTCPFLGVQMRIFTPPKYSCRSYFCIQIVGCVKVEGKKNRLAFPVSHRPAGKVALPPASCHTFQLQHMVFVQAHKVLQDED